VVLVHINQIFTNTIPALHATSSLHCCPNAHGPAATDEDENV